VILSALRGFGDAHWARDVASALGGPEGKVFDKVSSYVGKQEHQHVVHS